MSKIDQIIIYFNNLTDEEQISLFMNLGRFAERELPIEKKLIVLPLTDEDIDHITIKQNLDVKEVVK